MSLEERKYIVYHNCPGCKYRIGDLIFKKANYDFECPECRKYKFSQFKIVKIPLPEY